MKTLAFAVLLVGMPIVVHAQLNDSPPSQRKTESVNRALESISHTIGAIEALANEYDVLHARRVQLQTWVGKEQGTEMSDHTSRAHPSRVRAGRTVQEARSDMNATSHAEDLAYINRLLVERLEELRAGIRAEKNSIASLTIQLERLRNEDVPPMQ